MMQKLILYTKADCHLCELACHVLLNLADDVPLHINVVDITRTHQVELRYMERIPVLAKPDVAIELNWPFTTEDVRAYLSAVGRK
jgi:flavoprotein